MVDVRTNPAVQGTPQARSPMAISAAYANGYELNFTGADVAIMLYLNGRPALTLNLSPSTAKALGLGLVQMIADVEKDTGTKILCVDEVDELVEKRENKTP